MAMKYIKLWGNSISMSESLNFKWEWAVQWDYFIYKKGERKPLRRTNIRTFANRQEAREYKLGLLHSISKIENIKMKRRLVQANWENYSDSYTWNAGRPKRS